MTNCSTLMRVVKGHCSCRPGGKVYTSNPKRSSANALRRTIVTQTEVTATQQNSRPVKAEAPKIPVLSPDEGYAYFEAHILPMSEAKVIIAAHAFQYSTASFEAIRAS